MVVIGRHTLSCYVIGRRFVGLTDGWTTVSCTFCSQETKSTLNHDNKSVSRGWDDGFRWGRVRTNKMYINRLPIFYWVHWAVAILSGNREKNKVKVLPYFIWASALKLQAVSGVVDLVINSVVCCYHFLPHQSLPCQLQSIISINKQCEQLAKVQLRYNTRLEQSTGVNSRPIIVTHCFL